MPSSIGAIDMKTINRISVIAAMAMRVSSIISLNCSSLHYKWEKHEKAKEHECYDQEHRQKDHQADSRPDRPEDETYEAKNDHMLMKPSAEAKPM